MVTPSESKENPFWLCPKRLSSYGFELAGAGLCMREAQLAIRLNSRREAQPRMVMVWASETYAAVQLLARFVIGRTHILEENFASPKGRRLWDVKPLSAGFLSFDPCSESPSVAVRRTLGVK